MLSPRKRTSRREEKKKNLGKGKAWESFRGFRDRGCDRANRAIPIYAFLFNSPDRTEGAEERERKETREEVENVESRRRNRPVPACTREKGRGGRRDRYRRAARKQKVRNSSATESRTRPDINTRTCPALKRREFQGCSSARTRCRSFDASRIPSK